MTLFAVAMIIGVSPLLIATLTQTYRKWKYIVAMMSVGLSAGGIFLLDAQRAGSLIPVLMIVVLGAMTCIVVTALTRSTHEGGGRFTINPKDKSAMKWVLPLIGTLLCLMVVNVGWFLIKSFITI